MKRNDAYDAVLNYHRPTKDGIMAGAAQKLKILHLLRILETQTDDEHGLTGPQIIEKLAELGTEIERKTLYRDLDALREFGYDVQKYHRHTVEYGLASRDFEDGELRLMADAVQSSRFLTKRKSDKLVKEIAKLGSMQLADDLRKQIHVEGRIRTQNESVFYNLDAIQRAITAKKKVEFQYFKHDENKNRVLQHDGEKYCETPVQLMYMDDCYYLIVWNDKHSGFANYRVDRMLRINVSAEEATRNEQIATFDVAKYRQRVFGMFNGEAIPVTLRVRACAMSAVVDRFGKDVACAPLQEGECRVSATVMKAPTFFGWLTQFGTDVVIEAPESLRKAYAEHLHTVLGSYE